jgi:nuclear cap-binding protein subunit 1
LDKEIRLSFAKRIRDTLPQEYHPLIPESKEKEKPDFKYKDDGTLRRFNHLSFARANFHLATPYATLGRELLSLMRKKADDSTIQITLNQIHDEAAEHGIADVLVPSTDAYVTCICEIGAKSLSHVLSCIERCQGHLQKVGPQSEAARLQIITSVVEYWRDQPGTAINIVDKLLNYQALTPMCVMQWVLNPDRLGAGHKLAESWVFEMVANTIGKVTNRVRQVAAARLQVELPQDQLELLDDALDKERQGMRDLFKVIEDATSGVATGAKDELIAMTDDAEIALLKGWGERWRRVFVRKGAVEDAIVGEKAMEERKRLALEDVKRKEAEAREKMESVVEQNGGGAADGEADGERAGGDDVVDEIL